MTKQPIHVRWMIHRDRPQVSAIDEASFATPWSDCEFKQSTRQRNCIGMVAEDPDDYSGKRILGYMIYELHKSRLQIIKIAVDPNRRNRGVGNAFLDKLKGKLSTERRNRITIEVRESNLDAQLFLRACGFAATKIIRGGFADTGEDAYLMEHHYVESGLVRLGGRLGNNLGVVR